MGGRLNIGYWGQVGSHEVASVFRQSVYFLLTLDVIQNLGLTGSAYCSSIYVL